MHVAFSYQTTQERNGFLDVIVFGQGGSSTEIGQCPGSMLYDIWFVHIVLDNCNEVENSSISDNIVSVVDTVTGNVPDCPDCLLNSAHIWTFEELNK